MIPNHPRFIEAIHAKKKVCVRYYSQADNDVLDRVCAPLDYGPGGEFNDGLNRYWLWDYAITTGSHTLSLLPRQILELQVLGELFDPAQIESASREWSVVRDWSSPVQTMAPPAVVSSPCTN